MYLENHFRTSTNYLQEFFCVSGLQVYWRGNSVSDKVLYPVSAHGTNKTQERHLNGGRPQGENVVSVAIRVPV
jgi:hypothetical protein